MTLFPMENIKKVPPFWLNGGQPLPFCVVRFLDEDEDEEEEEAIPKNIQVIKVQNQGELEDDGVPSMLLKDPRFRSMLSGATTDIQDLEPRKIKSLQNPQPQDLKRKGVDCSVTCTHKPPHGKFEKGNCSYRVCAICGAYFPNDGGIANLECGHAYCTDCFAAFLTEKIQEDALKVICPVSKCKSLYTPKGVRGLIPKEVFDRWNDCFTEMSVLREPIYIRCPLEGCGKKFVDDEREFLIRACTNCWRLFCMRCKVGWHMGKSCSQYKNEEWELELELERHMFMRRGKWRRRGRGLGWPDSDRKRIIVID